MKRSCISVSDLPTPPAGKTGWPWTEGSDLIPPFMPDGKEWPRVSIVTASFNQGWAIEETIRSVLLQGYPNLEYIVMDGGSTDETLEILKKYDQFFDYWYSGPDQGQTSAMMEGFGRATGQIFGWMNSDDYYLPNALQELARLSTTQPDCLAWIGACLEVNRDGSRIREVQPKSGSQEDYFGWNTEGLFFHQPGCLFSADGYRKVGGLDPMIWGSMDMDLWIRLRGLGMFALTDTQVAAARIYPEMKSAAGLGGSKLMVDTITIAMKSHRRDIADRCAALAKKRWMRELADNIDPELAMRAINEEAFLNHMKIGGIMGYLTRRIAKSFGSKFK